MPHGLAGEADCSIEPMSILLERTHNIASDDPPPPRLCAPPAEFRSSFFPLQHVNQFVIDVHLDPFGQRRAPSGAVWHMGNATCSAWDT